MLKNLKSSSLLLLGLFLICFLIYYPILSSGPLWDDWVFIFKSRTLKTASPFTFWTFGDNQRSWPLFFTVLSIVSKLWKSNYLYFHFLNLVLHIFNTYLLAKILKKINGNYVLLLSFIYLVHPLHFFTVSWMIQLKTLMCIFFFLVSVTFFLKNLVNKSTLSYWLSVFFFAAALLSKSALAPIFLIMLFYFRKKMIPYIVICIYSIIITFGFNNFVTSLKITEVSNYFLSHAQAQNPLTISTPLTSSVPIKVANKRPMGAPQVTPQYSSDKVILTLGNFLKYSIYVFYPWDNLLIHPDTISSYAFINLITAIAFIYLITLLIFHYYETKDKISFLGLSFFILTIVPLCGIIYIPIFRYSNFVEYWLSLPFLGLIVCLSMLKKKWTSALVIAIWGVWLGYKSFKTVRLNPEPVSILTHSMKRSPENLIIQIVLAKHFFYKGEYFKSNEILYKLLRLPRANKEEIKEMIDNNNRSIRGERNHEYTL